MHNPRRVHALIAVAAALLIAPAVTRLAFAEEAGPIKDTMCNAVGCSKGDQKCAEVKGEVKDPLNRGQRRRHLALLRKGPGVLMQSRWNRRVVAGCWLTVGFTASASCGAARPSGSDTWAQRAVATLGADDGYLFVFSPFNCALRQRQIEAINELAGRTRRTGIVLSVGHEVADSAVARAAVVALDIRLRSVPLATTPLGRAGRAAGFTVPTAIAIRGGQVVSVVSGRDAERIDTWLEWLERR